VAANGFDQILIANRGEIACRIMRTVHRTGYATVAVFSDADAGALHVNMAGEAVHIGASPPAESYLDIARIIGAAKRPGLARFTPAMASSLKITFSPRPPRQRGSFLLGLFDNRHFSTR
jgi:geranyl-CoA carboxylase alpha subunit